MITLVRAVQTAIACPSQWDAWDEDGNYYYLRFRHGHGQVRQYRTADWADSDEDQYLGTVASFQDENPWAGEIGLLEFAERAGIGLAPELMYSSYGEHLRDELILNGTFGPEILEEG